jgi:hypothetical protein
MRKSYEMTLAASIGLLVLLIRLPLLGLPFERDEGEYAYIGWRMGFGELPYLDWFDQKAPGIFWVYRLALAFPIDPVTSVHWLGAIFSAGSALALFFLARRVVDVTTAAIGAALFAWISADPMIQGAAANTEIFMLLPTILANLVFLQVVAAPRPPPGRSLLAGALVGLAVAFKQVAAVNAVFFVIAYPLLARGDQRLKRLPRFIGWSALGGALVWLPILAAFHARGALDAMLDATLLHNVSYVGAIPLSLRLEKLGASLALLQRSQGAVWVLGFVGFVFLARVGRRPDVGYLAGWALASAVGVSASGHFFPHYFQQLLPPLAIAAGVAVKQIHDAPEWSRLPGWLRKAVTGGVAFAQPVAIAISIWLASPAEAIRRIYPGNPFEVMPGLAREIAAVTEPDDTVFIFGTEPEVLFYARRRSASRYIHLFPLYGPWSDAIDRQREVAHELREAPPALILFVPNAFFFADRNQQYLTRWVQRYIEKGYRPHATVRLDGSTRGQIHRVADGALPMPEGQARYAMLLVRRTEHP